MSFSNLIFACASAMLLQAQQAPEGEIAGRAVDPTLAPLRGVFVRVFPEGSRSLILRQHFTSSEFRVGVVPGKYTVKVWAPGFYSISVNQVQVVLGRATDLGSIVLKLAGCDSPGVICDEVTARGVTVGHNQYLAKGEVSLARNCGVELTKGRVACTEARSRSARIDVSLAATENETYLMPLNGATIGDCANSNYSRDRFRIDGLGPGDHVCVRTQNGNWSHLFFDEDVVPAAQEILLWFATRKGVL